MLFTSATRRRTLLVAFATGLLFLLLQHSPIPRSFVFNAAATVEKNESKVPGIKLSFPNETRKTHDDNMTATTLEESITNTPSRGNNNTFPLITGPSVLPDTDFRTNQILEIDSACPLFFKDGLQNICSNSEGQDSMMQSRNFSRPANHTFKCLTVSEDGTSAMFTTQNLSSLYTMIVNGDAVLFGAGIDQQTRNDTWFAGRLMNRLIQLRNALSHTASCGKLIILPKTLSNDDPESWGEFDCADFRRMGHPNVNGAVGTTAGSDGKTRVSSQQNKTQTLLDSCSMLFPENEAYWLFDVPSKRDFILDLKNRSFAAHRIFLAWWGLGPGYFRCNPCSGSDRNSTIAWLRSGDVFHKRHPPAHYGQPPLEYYIQSIKHSKASNVLLLWEDSGRERRINSNPLTSALENFDFGNQSGSDSPTTVTSLLREPFYKVLHRLFCSRNAIIGVSTLSTILTFSPNVQSIFLGKPWIYSQALEYGTADIYFYDVGVSHSLGLEYENNTSNNNIGLTNYSVYEDWTNSAEQRQEMLTFQGGTLKALLLQNSTT